MLIFHGDGNVRLHRTLKARQLYQNKQLCKLLNYIHFLRFLKRQALCSLLI